MDKSPRTIIDMFNSLASHYDIMNDVMTAFSHRRSKKVAIQLSGFTSNQKALDLATGTGDLAFLLTREARGIVIGTDISEKMLSIALTKAQKLGINSYISFQRADIDNLPFLDEIFDICTLGYGVRNVRNPLKTMKEIARVTKKGGRFIIVEATPPSNYFVRLLALFYFRKIAPLLAKLFYSNVIAYNYLAESISQFPRALDFVKVINRAGWKKVWYYPLYFGIVTVFLAIK